METRRVLMILGAYDYEQHRGIAQAARECSWHLDVRFLKSYRLPLSWRGDGIICTLNNNRHLSEYVMNSGLPAVDLSLWRQDLPLPRVAADNLKIGSLAAEHFLEYGHQHFAWFALSPNPVASLRLEGFRHRLHQSDYTVTGIGGRRTDDTAGVLKRLQRLPRPTAVFTASDLDAAWLLDLCLQSGLQVPRDVAILGVDNNTLICENQPVPLSSVNHDLQRIGFEGAQCLDRIMRGLPAPKNPLLILPNGITIRESTDALAVSDPAVRRALEWMQKEIRKSFSVGEVADQVGISRRNLEYRFRTALGQGVHEKCMELRLKNAEWHLLHTSESIEGIAALTGFANPPHLSRSFRKKYGTPPARFRRQMSTPPSPTRIAINVKTYPKKKNSPINTG